MSFLWFLIFVLKLSQIYSQDFQKHGALLVKLDLNVHI